MQFLYPSFLWALGFIIIPILIHLFNLRRYKKVVFTNVKYLKEIQQQTKRNRNVKQILILLSRIFAIASLVFLFAQPYFPIDGTKVKQGKRLVTIFIDNSFSMGSESESGPLLEMAKSKSNEILKAYPETDKFQIISQDFKSSSSRFLSRLDAQAIVDDIELSPATKPLSSVVSKIIESQGAESYSKRDVYLLSDFQNTELDPNLEFDSLIHFNAIHLQSQSPNNISIDSVFFESPFIKANEDLKLKAEISNNGSEDLESITIKMFVNQNQKLVQTIDLKANSSSTVELNFKIDNAGWKDAELVVEDHPIVFDNKYYFSFDVKKSVKILEIYEKEPSNYIKRLYKNDNYFEHDIQSKNSLNYSSLKNYNFIILNGIDEFSSGLNKELINFLEGGTILVIPSPDKNASLSLNNQEKLYQFDGVNLNESDVTYLDKKHPLFSNLFENIPQNIDLPKVKKSYNISSQQVFYTALLRMANQAPFLSEIKVGNGLLYVQSIPLEQEWSNFQQHAMFVPLYLKMAMATSSELPISYFIGRDQLLSTKPLELSSESGFKIKNEELELTPEVIVQNNQVYLNEGKQINKHGNYALNFMDSTIQKLSFNYDRSESKLQSQNIENIKEATESLNIKWINSKDENIYQVVNKNQKGTQIWKWFAVLSLFFIAIEILLLRFWPKG